MTTRPDLHVVDVVVDEGEAFMARCRDVRGDARVVGGLVWGLLRAVAECPRCPGYFRVPRSLSDWSLLHCLNCDGWWEVSP